MSGGNRQKAKGTAWETAIERYLWAAGHGDARRQVQRGTKDVGDIHVRNVALQAKDVAAHDLAGWCDDVRAQAANAGLPHGAVVVKRRRRGIGEGYVVMSLATFASMLHDMQ